MTVMPFPCMDVNYDVMIQKLKFPAILSLIVFSELVHGHSKRYRLGSSTDVGLVECVILSDGVMSRMDCAERCFNEHDCVAFLTSGDDCDLCWNVASSQLTSQGEVIAPPDSVYISEQYVDCEAGWLLVPGHGCYKAVMTRMSWDAAQENCESMNAYLVCFETREESDAVTAVLIEEYGTLDYYQLWTGARRTGLNVDFYWQETGGAVLIDDRWEAGDPDMNLNHYTMAIRSTGTPSYGWGDYVIDTHSESLCEAR